MAGILLLAGCAQQPGDPPARDDDVPITPAALAFIAADHVGEPDYATDLQLVPGLRSRPRRGNLRFGADGQYDGDAVAVVVGRATDGITTCADVSRYIDGCEELQDGLWYWGEETPEEDPGGVFVVKRKGTVTVRVAYYGDAITGDPREQDPPVDVQS